MNNKTDLIKKIRYHFGLNIYESNVWLALLNKGTASVGEIAEMSGVPRSRVYDVLESLEKQGFAIAQLGKPVRYMAVKPSVVLERLKSNMLRDAEDKIKLLSNIKTTEEYRKLEVLHNKRIEPIKPKQLSSYFRGRENIHSQIKNMLNEAEKEVIMITTTAALKRKLSILKPIFKKLKSNNIKITLGATPSEEKTNKITKKLNLSKELGVLVKKIHINTRFCIVDSNKTLFMITPDKEEENDTAILVKSPFFSKALITFLNAAWKN
jgi:sugar-specific transcriptional regulator TrmB